jgi:hypothetical protein
MSKTKVKFLFEKDSKEDILAVFPYEIADKNMNKVCYSSKEGHGICSNDYVKALNPVPKKLFEPLLNELISIGYTLDVIK